LISVGSEEFVSMLGVVLKPLLRKVAAMDVLRNDQEKGRWENSWIYSLICFGLCLLLFMLLVV
jgi:predicted lysophospholipase L1 biosynthesis ABC-type transport system permease subunit